MRGLLRDWWLPSGLATLLLLNARRGAESGYPDPLLLPVGVVLAATLVLGWRRRAPVAVSVVVCGTVTGYLLLLHADPAVQPALEPFLLVLAALFSLALHARAREFWLGLAASAAPLVATELAAVAAGRDLGNVAPSLVLWGCSVVLGRLLHLRAAEVAEARRRAEEAQRSAEEAAAAERARIARELHDVVAHGLSVVVLHAGVERRLVDDHGSSTAQALETIERTGRATLAELRQLLGLLHAADGTDEAGPLDALPTLERLEELASSARSAGHDVVLHRTGDQAPLPAGLELSAYRIVQEAVTNALRHSPGSPIRITVDRDASGLNLEVENGRPRSPGVSARVPGSGRGLIGMRERVRVFGGALSADPSPGGGFVVRARLPQEVV